MSKEPTNGWLSLQCWHCRVRLRLKEAYAHLRGRCPECGARIEAPKPQPAPMMPEPTSLDFDEDSPRLAPMEEEWPEPPRLEEDETQPGGNYELTTLPKHWQESSSAPQPRPPAVDGYELATGWTEAAPTPPPNLAEAYDVGSVAEIREREEEPGLYRLSRAEREPLREPPPPTYPLLEGIYFFPWQAPSNVRVWLLLGLGIGISLVFAIAVHFFWQLIVAKDLAGSLLPLPLTALLILGSITGAYGGSVFVAAVQETAAGNRDARWPDDAFFGRFAQFLYLVWLLSCAIWPVGIVLLIEPAWLRTPAIAVPLALLPVVLFPIFFLSSLAAQKPWGIIHGKVLAQMARQPRVVLVVFVVSVALAAACAALGYVNVIQLEFLWTPLTALVWSASILIYGRLLGRLAWLCARPMAKKKR
jgi:hypothetical protein